MRLPFTVTFPLLVGLNFISNNATLAKFPFYLHVDRKNYEMTEWDVCRCEL